MNIENDVLFKLTSRMPYLSKRQKNIAAFLCKNCDKAAFMTAAMLAAEVGVSESTVVRFANELGYDGYPDLRRALQIVLRERLERSKRPSSCEKLSRNGEKFLNTLNSDSQNIKLCANENNMKNFEQLEEILQNSREVYILGYDGLWPLAEFLENGLRHRKKFVKAIREDQLDYLADVQAGVLVIILSSGRKSPYRISISRYIRENGGNVALISSSEPNSALGYADLVIHTENCVGVMSVIRALTAGMDGEKIKDKKIAETEKLRMEYRENEQ